jgi:hypothetical protein
MQVARAPTVAIATPTILVRCRPAAAPIPASASRHDRFSGGAAKSGDASFVTSRLDHIGVTSENDG